MQATYKPSSFTFPPTSLKQFTTTTATTTTTAATGDTTVQTNNSNNNNNNNENNNNKDDDLGRDSTEMVSAKKLYSNSLHKIEHMCKMF